MPWTANIWSWLSNSWNPAVTGTPISSSDWNASVADLQTSLSDVPRYGTAQANAYRFGGIAGGTATALTATLSPAIAAYNNGLTLWVLSGTTANTGDSTLAVNGLAATQILFYGQILRDRDILPSTLYQFTYYNSKWHLAKPGDTVRPGGWKNLVPGNAGFEVWQRGAGGAASIAVAASTTAYTADRWYLATGANQAHVVSQQAGLSSSSRFSCRVQRNNAETGTTGLSFACPLDVDEAIGFRGKQVSGLIYLSTGANWSPTSGKLTVQMVFGTTATAAKRGGGYAGETVPLNFDINIAAGTAAAAYALPLTAAIATSVAQGEVRFTWTPVGAAGANDWFQVDDYMLVEGPVCEAYEQRPFADDLLSMQRHFWKSFDYATAPAQNAGTNGILAWRNTGTGAVASGSPRFGYPVKMRTAPTMITYNPSAANAEVRNATDAADCTATAASSNESGTVISYTGNAGAAVNEDFRVHATADAGI